MSKGGQNTQTTGPDQFGNYARQQLWGQATQVAGQPYQPYGGQMVAGPSSEYMTGLDTLHNVGDIAGGLTSNLGFAMTPFSQAALQPYMNPYQQNVVDAVHQNFDRQRGMADTAANQEATMAGAFGGSRGDILKAQNENNVNLNEANTISQLNQQGYNDAANRFMGDRSFAANLGFGGLNALSGVAGSEAGAGQYLTGLGQQQLNAEQNQFNQARQWPYQQLGFLGQMLQGMPQGSVNTQQKSGSLLGTLGGLAGIGAAFIPGAGPAAAAVGTAANGFGNGTEMGAFDPVSSNLGFGNGENYNWNQPVGTSYYGG